MLISSLLDQIEFQKTELLCKDTIIKLIIENSKCSSDSFQNKNNIGSNKIEKFTTPKKSPKSKHQTIEILKTLYPSIGIKYYNKAKEVDTPAGYIFYKEPSFNHTQQY